MPEIARLAQRTSTRVTLPVYAGLTAAGRQRVSAKLVDVASALEALS